jgi:hypothetical protein
LTFNAAGSVSSHFNQVCAFNREDGVYDALVVTWPIARLLGRVVSIAHARKIVYQSPQEAVAAIRVNVSEEKEESCCHDRNV